MDAAKLYNKSNELQRNDAKKVIEECGSVLKWNGADTILDIGCGTGDVMVDLVLSQVPLSNFKRIVGFDLSEKMVQFARNKYCRPEVPLAFEVADIGGHTSAFESYRESFDHITSFFCLHWVQNQELAFENINFMLKKGGDFLVSILAQNPIFEVYERLARSPEWGQYMSNFMSFISPYQKVSDPVAKAVDMLGRIFQGSFRVFIKDRVFVFEDEKVLKASVFAVCPFISKIPSDRREAFFQDYVKHISDLGCHVNGRFLSPYKTLVIAGVKGNHP